MRRGTWTMVLIGIAGYTAAAHASVIGDYAIFGKDAVTFEGFATVAGGPAGTNGSMTHAGGVGAFQDLRGGGIFNGDPGAHSNARQNVTGSVLFNGDVRINDLSIVTGNIVSGGLVSIGSSV